MSASISNHSALPERRRTNFPGAKYVLPSDEIEGRRLTKQHGTIKRLLDDKLVLPPMLLSPGDKVLDSGTGTTVWLSDLATTVPETVELHGIDIESYLFPPPEDHPTNFKLSVANVTNLPIEWSDTFTLINQRLLVGALKRTEWPVALSELYRVTKPNGWIQLLEATHWEGGQATNQMADLVRKLCGSRGIDVDVPLSLEDLVKDAGFRNVHATEYKMVLGKSAGGIGAQHREFMMDLWNGLKDILLLTGLVSSEEDLSALLNKAEKEMEETYGACLPFFVLYGQK
ncbi:hypothetical protein BDQ17DRAFT_1243432 [Cyathus striatus]|nr:hypothetical protein BDQ17DRAFT_1243432 [Cyathus striatus]